MDWDKEEQEKYNKALQELKSLKVDSSPFLKTRVMANLETSKSVSNPLKRWIPALLGSVATVAIALVLSFQMGQQTQTEMLVELGKPYMLKADLRPHAQVEASYITLELEGKIEFSSQKFAKIRELRSLKMSWENLAGKQYLPIVIKGVGKGYSVVKLHFYDENHNLIKTQTYDFNFQEGAS